MRILITGGAGFVGSNLAFKLKTKYPNYFVAVADNLTRRGSELNLPKLQDKEIRFFHCDIRLESDLSNLPEVDIIIDASADPSVLSGIESPSVKLIQSNLFGTVNLIEMAIRNKSKFIFLSTSRVYPYGLINSLSLEETETRFQLKADQKISGVTTEGISEQFPLNGSKSFYGAAKFCSEVLIQEYIELKGLEASVLRCGVIAGPGQFGKVDQGVIVFWLAAHYWKNDLTYFGYGGKGKQIRDILHIDDLTDLIDIQIHGFEVFSGLTFNVGGGHANSVSLCELTSMCQTITGNQIEVRSRPENRAVDIPYYVTDNKLIEKTTGWRPAKSVEVTLRDIYEWLKLHESTLIKVLYQRSK
ncbi:MAG: NAD-dependent epimerase/dehydratase family protein [Bacteroidetes bacterium]|nr:NAD-dependent epimerase/dehydratase family protein [Bacteroidota bacterium]